MNQSERESKKWLVGLVFILLLASLAMSVMPIKFMPNCPWEGENFAVCPMATWEHLNWRASIFLSLFRFCSCAGDLR